MKIIYAHTTQLSEEHIKTAQRFGFDTIIGYFTPELLDIMRLNQMRAIPIDGMCLQHSAIVGYYVYDEPDLNGVSIEDQEKQILKYHRRSWKPLFVACVENTTKKLSDQYDFYLLDIYYGTTLSKIKNYLNAAFSSQFIRVLYGRGKVVPIMGVFDDAGLYQYSPEILPFARFFRRMFVGSNSAVYIYERSTPSDNGVINRPQYTEAVKSLNDMSSVCWYRPLCYGVAWVFIKVNNCLGKYKLTIGG
jgi:hypothetical protein